MIIITAPVHPKMLQYLESKKYEVVYEPGIKYDELSSVISKATGLVVTTRLPVDKSILEKATNLKWIGRLGSGMEIIDVDFASQNNILCVSSPEGNRNAVGEHALGLLLNIMHKISKSEKEVRKKIWLRDENRGTEVTGKIIGLVGYGNTGEAFSTLLKGFKVTILAYDIFRYGFGQGNIKEANLEQICRYADVISFHVPLTKETHHIANTDFFNSLKKKPVILNTSRGKIIDTKALIVALKNGNINGAGLDVLENESISGYSQEEAADLDFLANHERVIVTPHIAGYTDEAFLKMSEVLIRKLKL